MQTVQLRCAPLRTTMKQKELKRVLLPLKGPLKQDGLGYRIYGRRWKWNWNYAALQNLWIMSLNQKLFYAGTDNAEAFMIFHEPNKY